MNAHSVVNPRDSVRMRCLQLTLILVRARGQDGPRISTYFGREECDRAAVAAETGLTVAQRPGAGGKDKDRLAAGDHTRSIVMDGRHDDDDPVAVVSGQESRLRRLGAFGAYHAEVLIGIED